MKKWIALLLAGILLLSGIATAEEAPAAEEDLSAWENWVNPYPDRDYGELRVGNPTPMDGKFFTGMWGNATSDIDVRSLVHGYRLTTWGEDTGIFRKSNHVVSGMMIADDPEGNRVYTMALYDDLYFSDGTKITAWDYAFSVLFQAAPEIAETGGRPVDLGYLLGYEEYISGEAQGFAGVRVKNDRLIEFTVKHEYLPYFFELYRLSFCPFPIREIAPGWGRLLHRKRGPGRGGPDLYGGAAAGDGHGPRVRIPVPSHGGQRPVRADRMGRGNADLHL